MEVLIKSERELQGFAEKLAPNLSCGVVFLDADLGAGKTTFVRYLLRALGEKSKIKSPTYSIVESYNLQNFTVHHFDLYRLSDPQELEFLGIRDFYQQNSLLLFEWSAKGKGFLPPPDLIINIEVSENSVRTFKLNLQTNTASVWLANL